MKWKSCDLRVNICDISCRIGVLMLCKYAQGDDGQQIYHILNRVYKVSNILFAYSGTQVVASKQDYLWRCVCFIVFKHITVHLLQICANFLVRIVSYRIVSWSPFYIEMINWMKILQWENILCIELPNA